MGSEMCIRDRVDCACSKLLFTVLIVPSIRRWRIDFKISELVVGELTNMREVPAKSTKLSHCRGTPFLAISIG